MSENDGFAEELLKLFVEQSELAVRSIGEATARADFDVVKYYAHRLKGSAANVGARQLSRKASELEELAKDGALDEDRVRVLLDELSQVREASLTELRRLFGTAESAGASGSFPPC